MVSLSRPFSLVALCAVLLGCFAHDCEASSICHGAPALVRAPSAPHFAPSDLRPVVSTGVSLPVAGANPLQFSAAAVDVPQFALERDGFSHSAQGRAPPASVVSVP